MTFAQKLAAIVQKNNSLVCVGLDSDFDKIPLHLKTVNYPLFEFNKAIIDSTSDLVCAYKPNSAFYEAEGARGIEQLKMTADYLHKSYPEVPIILDAKRADIGSTNEGYAKFAFEYLGTDAITVHQYVGKEGLKPFLNLKDKGIFVYCRSSNRGAGEFQDLIVAEIPFYQVVAGHVVKEWNYNGNCGLIVGATYPTELEIVRRIAGDGFPLLIPGIGTQGADIESTVRSGVDKNGASAIINSSRGIIYADSSEKFAEIARIKTQELKDQINKFRFIA